MPVQPGRLRPMSPQPTPPQLPVSEPVPPSPSSHLPWTPGNLPWPSKEDQAILAAQGRFIREGFIDATGEFVPR